MVLGDHIHTNSRQFDWAAQDDILLQEFIIVRLQAGRVAAARQRVTRGSACCADRRGTPHHSAGAGAGHSCTPHYPASSCITRGAYLARHRAAS
jgi:hypothetical protein